MSAPPPPLSPELVLVSPDLWELALEQLPPVGTVSATAPPPPRPVESSGRSPLGRVLGLLAYVVLTIALRVALGVGIVVAIALLLA